jgi:phosphate uptake regulator
MSKIKIPVLKADIRRGVQDSPCDCALARAARRVLGKDHDIEVEIEQCLVDMTAKKAYKMTKKAMNFIDTFDENKSKVEPDVFELTETDYPRTAIWYMRTTC